MVIFGGKIYVPLKLITIYHKTWKSLTGNDFLFLLFRSDMIKFTNNRVSHMVEIRFLVKGTYLTAKIFEVPWGTSVLRLNKKMSKEMSDWILSSNKVSETWKHDFLFCFRQNLVITAWNNYKNICSGIHSNVVCPRSHQNFWNPCTPILFIHSI